MDTTGSLEDAPKRKKTNAVLALFIFVLLAGISIGLYLLGNPTAFAPRAASDTFTKCGPPGHCNDYGWTDAKSYTKVPTNCYVAVYKCHISKWDQVARVGCQKNTSDPSKNTAYYAEIHKLTSSNPNPKIWDKVVSGSDGNGHLKGFAPPQFCGIWQTDVGPPCNFSFHERGDKRDSICKVSQTHNICDGKACKKVKGAGKNECSNPGKDIAPQCTHKECKNNQQCVLVAGGKAKDKCQTDKDCKKTTPSPSTCPVPSPVKNLKISCPLCNLTE